MNGIEGVTLPAFADDELPGRLSSIQSGHEQLRQTIDSYAAWPTQGRRYDVLDTRQQYTTDLRQFGITVLAEPGNDPGLQASLLATVLAQEYTFCQSELGAHLANSRFTFVPVQRSRAAAEIGQGIAKRMMSPCVYHDTVAYDMQVDTLRDNIAICLQAIDQRRPILSRVLGVIPSLRP